MKKIVETKKNEFEKADRLWQILEIAVNDFEDVVRWKDVIVNMGIFKVREGKVCHVCLAGSVLLKQYDSIGDVHNASQMPKELDAKMMAIDMIRNRNIGNAYIVFYGEDVSVPHDLPKYELPYRYERAGHIGYISVLRRVIADLKAKDY